MSNQKLLEIKNLKISFPFQDKQLEVVRGISLTIEKNDILGILGESGSGKTVTATAMLGLTGYDGGSVDNGEILLNGVDITKLKEKEWRKIRGKEISFIFQNNVDTLNPYRKIGKQLEEVQRVHKQKLSKAAILDMLGELGLQNPELVYDMYPSQLSGGQCQRVGIAMALIGKAKIIIADEPTSSIDASMQGLVIDLLKRINKKFEVSIVIITHNFEVAKALCSKVVILYGGLLMEQGTASQVIDFPIHPYTKELLNCTKSINERDKVLHTLEGTAQTPLDFREECPFFSRCPVFTEKCRNGIPELKIYEDGRAVRCIRI